MKTYSEQRQAILFKAARQLRVVAAQVLDDTVDAGAGISRQTVRFCIQHAANAARLAWDLEEKGHEQCVATQRQNTDLSRSHDYYSGAINRFEARVRAANGLSYTESVAAWAADEYEVVLSYGR